MGVYIQYTSYDYTQMQGPAPSGFHVPLSTEWQGVKTIMTSLSLTTGDNWRISLHMPFAGRRTYSDASLIYQGSVGYYWSSSSGSASSGSARFIYLNSSRVTADYYYRAYGHSVRCFKDSYVAPDSSWTVVQGSLGSAGIFWNQSQGLISITDGSTGYTIMDKNLGATTVYNDGDTLNEANCGKYYQRGNNYGFPRTGSVTTSSTQVDASGYGPGNCYSSSTFITGSADRSSVQNDNLWGAITGVNPMSELKNAYIGEYRVPGQNTYIYYPLTSDLVDIMGNGDTGTMTGTCTFDSSTGIHVTGRSNNYVTGMSLGVNNRNTFTLNVWVKLDDRTTDGQCIIGYTSNTAQKQAFKLEDFTSQSGIDCAMCYGSTQNTQRPSSKDTNWHNYCLVGDGTKYQWYYDGETLGSAITTSSVLNNISELQLGWGGYYGSSRSANGYIKDYIVETVARTADKVADYYNSTKSNYGL